MTHGTSTTSSKIYWSVCMPKLCYGPEVMDVSTNVISNMEAYKCLAKHSQNLPEQCSDPDNLATLGWKSIREHCNFLNFIFLWQSLSFSFVFINKYV